MSGLIMRYVTSFDPESYLCKNNVSPDQKTDVIKVKIVVN